MSASSGTQGAETFRLACAIGDIASRAGAVILKIAAENRPSRLKADRSPVTEADETAEAMIAGELQRLAPGVAIVAEEAAARAGPALPAGPYFLIDPIDGTREFIEGRDEFTVNIALVENHTPRLGVVYAPRRNALYLGEGSRALRGMVFPGMTFDAESALPIRVRPRGAGIVALVSRSHADPAADGFLAKLGIAERVPFGSSLKFAHIAEGAADIYARFAPLREWDIAAGHALVEAAGGRVTAPDGSAVRYGREANGFRVEGFVVWGAPAQS